MRRILWTSAGFILGTAWIAHSYEYIHKTHRQCPICYLRERGELKRMLRQLRRENNSKPLDEMFHPASRPEGEDTDHGTDVL